MTPSSTVTVYVVPSHTNSTDCMLSLYFVFVSQAFPSYVTTIVCDIFVEYRRRLRSSHPYEWKAL